MPRRKKKPTVPAGRRRTTSGSGVRASQQLAGMLKANELASSGDLMEPANRRPGRGAGSASLPATSSVTSEQAAVSSRITRAIRERVDVRGCTGRAHQSPDRGFWFKVSWCGETPSTATRQILALTEGWHRRLMRKPRATGTTGQSRLSPAMGKSTKLIAFGAHRPSTHRLPWLRFLRDFSSVARQMPGYAMQSRGTACTFPPPGVAASPKRLKNVAYFQPATEPVWAPKPDSQPTKIYPSPYLVQGNLD